MNYLPTSRAASCFTEPTCPAPEGRTEAMLRALLKTYRHTEYDTLDKIDPRSLREAVAIGAVSGYKMVNEGDWPEYRTKEDVEEIRKIARM